VAAGAKWAQRDGLALERRFFLRFPIMGILFRGGVAPGHGLRIFARLFAWAGLIALCGCHRSPPPPALTPAPVGPLPFTGTLTEIDGVTAVVSLLHPRLINSDLEKLTAGVPETALARTGLAQLAPYGYPTFSDIADGSKVGLAIVLPPDGAAPGAKPAVVAFVKLKDGGKIATFLAAFRQTLVKHGDWTLVAQNQDSIDRIKAPDSVIAYLERPQREDVRVWARVDPFLLSRLEQQLWTGLQPMLAQLSPNERTPAHQYVHALFGLLSQVHSVEASLIFTDHDIELGYGVQFVPDSAIGTGLRYPLPSPDSVAIKIPAGSVLDMAIRQNPEGTRAIGDAIFDSLIAVDNPPFSDALKRAKTSYAGVAKASDGFTVGTMDISFDRTAGPAAPQSMFMAMPGHLTQETLRAYQQSTHELMTAMLRGFAKWQAALPHRSVTMQGQLPPEGLFSYQPNAITVDGLPFDAIVAEVPSVAMTAGAPAGAKTLEYVGVANGAMLVATSKATLERNLPYVLGTANTPNAIQVPGEAGVAGRVELNGGKLMESLVKGVGLDRNDPDVSAQLSSLSGAYADGGPVTGEATIDQARIGFTVKFPYKFIEASVHFGQFCVAEKVDWMKLFATPPGAHPLGGGANHQ